MKSVFGGERMNEIIDTYEQFCIVKNRNVLLEQRFTPDGEYTILCKSCTDCHPNACKCVKQFTESLKISKYLQK